MVFSRITRHLITSFKNYLIYFFIALINIIRPLLGPPGCCRYYITCTRFAEEQLKTQPLLKAIKEIIKRLLSCNSLLEL